MRRLLALGVACLAVIAISAVFLAVSVWRYTDYEPFTAYPSIGYVVDIDIDRDIVTVEDADGYLWEFDGIEEWEPGDLAAMLMHDNGTPDNAEDDVILSAVQSGFSLLEN